MQSLVMQIRLAAMVLALFGALSFGWATWKTPGIPHAPFMIYALMAALASAYGVFIGARHKRFIPRLGNALAFLAALNVTTGLLVNGALAISALPAFIALALVLGSRTNFIAISLWLLTLAAYVLFWKAAASEIPAASRSFLSATIIAATGGFLYRIFTAFVNDQESSRAELERSEARFRALFEGTNEGILLADPETQRFRAANPTMCDLLGYSPQEIQNLKLTDIHPPAELALVSKQFDAYAKGEPCYAEDVRLLRKDGTERIVNVAPALIHSNGETLLAGIFRDVTDLRKVEMALDAHRNNLEKLVASRTAELQLATERLDGLINEQKTILDNASLGILYLKDRKLAWFNQNLCKLLGYDASELAGRPARFLYDVGSESDYQRSVEEGLAILMRGERLVKEVRGKCKGGSRIWGQISAQAIDPADPLAGIIVCVEDVTERKAMQDRMDELIREQQTILDNATVGITHTRDRVMVWTNPYLERMFGYGIDELKGRSVELLYASQSDYLRIGQEGIATLARGEQFQVDVQGKRKDGTVIWVRVSSQCLNTENPAQDVIVCVEDIMETKQNHAQLEEARLIAEAGSRAKSEFLANMSHEIRTPMNGVLGLAAIIRNAGLSPRQLDLMQRLENSGHHLLQIIDDILDMAKIEAGKIEINKEPVSITTVAQSIESIMQDQIASKHLILTVETDNLPAVLLGDEVRLRQAWLNLLGNAVKFTDRGTIRLRSRMVEDDTESVLVRFEVDDDGIGISADVLPRLFAEFEQADNSATRKHGGTGLGLALVRRLARLMGGEAGVSSTLGVGSLFWFTARLRKDKTGANEALRPMTGPEAIQKLKTEYTGWRVLVVEDEPVNRLVAEFLLTEVGLVVDLAGNGHEAVEKAEESAYDLILMDMQMPDMDGLQATREIREGLKLDVPIIALTANAFERDRQACIDAGMNDFMTKPFVEAALYTTIVRWLDHRDEAVKVCPPISGR